jgi:hypothetical protein
MQMASAASLAVVGVVVDVEILNDCRCGHPSGWVEDGCLHDVHGVCHVVPVGCSVATASAAAIPPHGPRVACAHRHGRPVAIPDVHLLARAARDQPENLLALARMQQLVEAELHVESDELVVERHLLPFEAPLALHADAAVELVSETNRSVALAANKKLFQQLRTEHIKVIHETEESITKLFHDASAYVICVWK